MAKLRLTVPPVVHRFVHVGALADAALATLTMRIYKKPMELTDNLPRRSSGPFRPFLRVAWVRRSGPVGASAYPQFLLERTTRAVCPCHAHRGRLLCAPALLGLALGWMIAAGDSTVAQEVSPGQRLVDRGRTIGLMTHSPTAHDAERVLVWMQAAARLSPTLAEAHLWQYDLLTRLGRDPEALAALTRYTQLNPGDLSARIDLLEARFNLCQSVDQRIAYCRERLAELQTGGASSGDSSNTPGRPTSKDLQRSGLHRRMADLHFRAGDSAVAEQEARRAVEAFPGNAAALALLVELADEPDRPVRQVRASLAAIAASPTDVPEMWRLARALDDLAMGDEAAVWYQRARVTMERAAPNRPLPEHFLLDEARSHADAGRYEQAFEAAEKLVSAAPNNIAARFLLLDLATRSAKADVVASQKAFLVEKFGKLASSRPASAPAAETADTALAVQAAWYYTLFAPDAEKAVKLARQAIDAGEPTGRVVYGLAELLAGNIEKAVETLTSLAPRDPWAAAGLGEALIRQGKFEDAVRVLREGEALRRSGLAYERIGALLNSQDESLVSPTMLPEVQTALREFDARVLDFVERPSEAIRLEVSAASDTWAFGDPWRCDIRLTNIAPYPVFIGDGRMIEGRILVSLAWGESSTREWPGYLPLALHDQPVLPPGASVSRTITLDVGPAAALAASFPQRELELTARFVLDPVQGAGGWLSALKGFPEAVLKITRPAVDASRMALDRLMKTVRTGSEQERVHALGVCGSLLREAEAETRGELDYTPRRVDEVKLAREVIAALQAPFASVRVAALEALRGTTFTKRTLEQVAPLLSDPDWLVRLTTLDVLAEVQGEKLRPVLEKLASADADDLVRRAAGTLMGSLPR